jgi:hypothetical protein
VKIKEKCCDCVGRCNAIGYPSVTRGSPHCRDERLRCYPLRKRFFDFLRGFFLWI